MKNKNYFKKLLLLMLIGFTNFVNAQVPSYVPTNGLIGYWPFNGNANDTSGNNLNGTNNGATLTTDRFGNINAAYNFNGIDNFINVNHNGALNAFPITLTIWCKGTKPLGILLSKYTSCSSNNGWAIHTNANKVSSYYFNFLGGAQNNFDVFGTGQGRVITDDVWHMITITYTNTGGNIYVDNLLVLSNSFNGSGSPSACTNTQNLFIGKDLNSTNCSAGNFNYLGKLDDIGIWNRVLTTDEITNLYNANLCYQSSFIINTGILSYNPPTYNNTITMFPNPANDHITIDCGTIANVVGYHIEIANSLGQIVFNQPMNTQQYTVALNTWSGQGIYFVKVYDASNTLLTTRKLILQ